MHFKRIVITTIFLNALLAPELSAVSLDHHEPGSLRSPSLWSQVGQDIPGDEAKDLFGMSVALSSNGTIVAAGAPWHTSPEHENDPAGGQVRVFSYEETNDQWTQLGQEMIGAEFWDHFGWSVALSGDGSIVAAGAPNHNWYQGYVRVFSYDNSNCRWDQLGEDIGGEDGFNEFGESVAIATDGLTVAAGASTNDGNGVWSGHVRVFSYDKGNDQWDQVGQDIDGSYAAGYFGHTVALSANGSIVASGSISYDVSIQSSVRVFSYDNVSDRWNQIGQDIEGIYVGQTLAVALSSDGFVVAVGAHTSLSDIALTRGSVRVFSYDSQDDQWNQVGQDIDGKTAEETRFGYSIALSANGSTVAAGAPFNDDDFVYISGRVRVYSYDDATDRWNQASNDIEGETVVHGNLGWGVSLSADGSIVAAGAPARLSVSEDPGHVRVFTAQKA